VFFIFGVGKKTIKTHWEEGMTTCERCRNTRQWPLKKVTSWFTFFLIPIVPYSVQYVKVCPVCGHYTEITKEKYESGEEKPDEMTLEVRKPVNNAKHMSEVQRRFNKEMAAYNATEAQKKQDDKNDQ